MPHTLVALVEDKPGVLNRVASLFRRRGLQHRIADRRADRGAGVSRMTIVVDSDQTSADRVIAYLNRLVNVLHVENLGGVPPSLAISRSSRSARDERSRGAPADRGRNARAHRRFGGADDDD